MLGCWLVALCVVSVDRYDWFAVCICGAIAIACSRKVFVQDIAIQNPLVRLEFGESGNRLN